jgi:hypothetical protein
MSREVRMIPAGWEHPRFTVENAPFPAAIGKYIPLESGDVAAEIAEWDMKAAKWAEGLRFDFGNEKFIPIEEENRHLTYAEWAEDRPDPARYMPQWKPEECNLFALYETTSEGTPKTPGFPTLESLADYLVANNITYFADYTCSWAEWMKILNDGKSFGMEITVYPDGTSSAPRPA